MMADSRSIPAIGEVTVYEGRHGSVAHLSSDMCIGRSLAIYGEWGEDELALLAPLIRPGSTVLDIGANIGTHTLAFARIVGEGGLVVSIEAQPEIYALLCRNIVTNGFAGRVRPIQMLAGSQFALSPYMGQAMTENLGARTFVNEVNMAPVEGRITLPQAPIDSLGIIDCSLIKIDVEGMELPVLISSGRLLSSQKPYVYFEHATGDVEELTRLHKFFTELRYQLFWHIANPVNVQNFKGSPDNIFGGAVETNILCCPHGQSVPEGLEPLTDPRAKPTKPPVEVSIKGVSVPEYLPARETLVPQPAVYTSRGGLASFAKGIAKRIGGRGSHGT